jgi:AhpD family alkylhydroperoxidase
MAGILLKAALRKSLAQIQHVTPVRAGGARSEVAEVYRQMEREFGMLAPPVALHSPAPELLAACWVMLRESLIASGRISRDTKEAVATAVSQSNICPYCVDVHSSTLDAFAGGAPDDPDGDHRIRRVVEWARACATTETLDAEEQPFPAESAPELIGVVVTFHYINRMVNVFLPDSPVPEGVPGAVRTRMRRLLGRFMQSAIVADHEAGKSLDLLPDAGLPPDLAWARGSAHVSAAFARAAAAFESAGERSVPRAVRELVSERLAGWTGQPPEISRSWADEAVAGLPEADRPAGKLALLTAVASYQLDPSVIADYRASRPDDRSLIEIAAWASMAAARRIGSWVHLAGRPPNRHRING